MRQLCDKYDLPYNTGSLPRQLGSVFGKIFKLALPGRRTPAPTAPEAVKEDTWPPEATWGRLDRCLD